MRVSRLPFCFFSNGRFWAASFGGFRTPREWIGLIPQRQGSTAVYSWETKRVAGEEWEAFMARCADVSMRAIGQLPGIDDLPANLDGRILYNLTWVSEAEYGDLSSQAVGTSRWGDERRRRFAHYTWKPYWENQWNPGALMVWFDRRAGDLCPGCCRGDCQINHARDADRYVRVEFDRQQFEQRWFAEWLPLLRSRGAAKKFFVRLDASTLDVSSPERFFEAARQLYRGVDGMFRTFWRIYRTWRELQVTTDWLAGQGITVEWTVEETEPPYPFGP